MLSYLQSFMGFIEQLEFGGLSRIIVNGIGFTNFHAITWNQNEHKRVRGILLHIVFDIWL